MATCNSDGLDIYFRLRGFVSRSGNYERCSDRQKSDIGDSSLGDDVQRDISSLRLIEQPAMMQLPSRYNRVLL